MEYTQTKYGEIRTRTVGRYIRKKKNDVYKLLPLREEEGYWKEHLETICIELNGCYELFDGRIELLEICSKLESLRNMEEFMVYRKTIFEILNCLERLEVEDEE